MTVPCPSWINILATPLVAVVVCHIVSVQDASLLDIDSDCEHYEGSVDFGRELGVLHSVLRDCLSINEVRILSYGHCKPQ